MKKKPIIGLMVLAVVLVLIGFVGYRSLAKSSTVATPTRSAKVQAGTVRPTITTTGNISLAGQTQVNFENAGKIIEVAVKPGDVVEAGRVLGKIDPQDLQRAVDQAKSSLERAKLMRDQALGNDDVNVQTNQISVDTAYNSLLNAQAKLAQLKSDYPTPNAQQQQQIDQGQSTVDQSNAQYQQALIRLQSAKDAKSYDARLQDMQVAQAKQALEDANADLASATLTAPVAGTVIAVNYSVGDRVSGSSSSSTAVNTTPSGDSSQPGGAGGSAFVVIGDPAKFQTTFTIDQSDITNVKVGMSVDMTPDALQEKTFKGKISSIDPTPTSSQGVTTYSVYASVDKPDPALRQGMSVTAKIDLGARKNVLVVPNMAIRAASGGRVVRKIVDGQLANVSVVTGASDDEYTEIKSGLMEGDEISMDVFQSTGSSSIQQTRGRTSGMGIPGMGGGPPGGFSGGRGGF
ncbi:MAG: HlyD family efflux transporter periplasmic adaptor subunit [Actinobacteria bacterium]|nr:HlyD family efflux transporter periplasmic adaptor subunit [Actinomycetota bacterium]